MKFNNIIDLFDIDILKVLYLENINAFKVTYKDVIKKIVKVLMFDCPELKFDIHGKELLVIDTRYHRPDHDTYWKRYIELFNDFDRIIFDGVYTKGRMFKKFCPLTFLKRLYVFIKIYNELSTYKNKLHRKYLSIVLTNIWIYKKKMRRCILHLR